LTLIEILLLVGLLIALGMMGLLMRQIGALREGADAREGEQMIHQLNARIGDMATQSERRAKESRQELTEQLRANREELGKSISTLSETVRKLGAEQAEGQTKFGDRLDAKMKELRQENTSKLDEMRKTVDEKLQTTLERRLSESFKAVSERLEAVQRGLGEMQSLATGVGDLKRVLTNVKSRGTFGEVQLGLLIEDFLTPDQYLVNYDCGKASGNERVEYGIRVPGMERDVYLPIDAKFPTEDYERLLAAVEVGDVAAVEAASTALERTIKRFAKDVSSKYINPPHTADWAILFLPTEGLYAEVLRRPGLFETLQRDMRVTVAGPANFQVLLSTFRMGFRQLALQERANEVWDVLGAVKLEFGRFGEQIDRMGKSLNSALNHVETLDRRKRVMLKALKNVEEVEGPAAAGLLEEDV
jgi:DNA recombination protein RmuC